MSLGEVMRRRRAELGLSQADVAAAAGVDKRQVRRYEADEQQPVLSVAVALAAALRLDLGELAGATPPRVRLTGAWWAAWQPAGGAGVVTAQEVRLEQHGEQVLVAPAGGDGRRWHGELRLWDGEVLTGWYAARDDAVRRTGTLYLVLHPQGRHLVGRWVGSARGGRIGTGLAALAPAERSARDLVGRLEEGTVVAG